MSWPIEHFHYMPAPSSFIEMTQCAGVNARRFINLVYTLHDNHVRLIASADVEPNEIYVDGLEIDLFPRTVSRLVEIRSQD